MSYENPDISNNDNQPDPFDMSVIESWTPQDGFACMDELIAKQLDVIEAMYGIFMQKFDDEHDTALYEMLESNTKSVIHALEALREEYSNDDEAIFALLTYIIYRVLRSGVPMH